MNATSPSPAQADSSVLALRATVRASIRPVVGGLAAVYLVFAVGHGILLPPHAAVVMVPLAALTAVVFAAVAAAAPRIPLRGVHPTTLAVGLLVLFNASLHMLLAADPLQASNLALTLIGAGSVMLSLSSVAAMIVAAVAAWAAVTAMLPAPSGTLHFGFTLGWSSLLALLICYVRRRQVLRLEDLRRSDRTHATLMAHTAADARRGEKRLRALIDASLEAIVLIEGTNIAHANRRARELIGAGLDGDVDDLLATLDLGGDADARAALLDGSLHRARQHVLGAHEPVPVELVSRALAFDQRTVIYLALRDLRDSVRAVAAEADRDRLQYELSQLEQMQAQLVEARLEAEAASRLKDTMLANMSHEIRTPMTAILGFSELLTERLSGSEHEKHATMIHDGGQRLLHLLDQLVDLSRLEAQKATLRKQNFAIDEIVSRVADLFAVAAERKGIELSVDSEGEIVVYADPLRCEQVLTNVVANAIRFTDQGHVRLRVRQELRDGRAFGTVEVADTGRGIDAKFLPFMFDEFRQESTGTGRSHEGSGLGLSIAKRLVEAMDGQIAVRSVQGEGTTMAIRLPLEVQTMEATA